MENMIKVIVLRLFSLLSLCTPKKNKVMTTQKAETQKFMELQRIFIAFMEDDPRLLTSRCADQYNFMYKLTSKLKRNELVYLSACITILTARRLRENDKK